MGLNTFHLQIWNLAKKAVDIKGMELDLNLLMP